jgi:uncharacterized membrane protein HdeD (DUF308 family)
MNGRRLHRSATMALSALMFAIGVALLAEAIAGGRAVAGVVGVLFLAAGAGRIYVERQRGRRE